MIEGFAVGVMVGAFIALIVVLKAKKYLFHLWWLLLLTPAFSQNCDYIVSDEAGMLSGSPRDRQVLIDANDLINQGADVKIRTLVSSGGNLDMAMNAMEARCPSWQGTNGARKSTLLVIAVSKDRKYGIYFGSAWHKALDDHWNRIKTDYMSPRLKSGDTTGAFIAAEEQLTKRLIASKDESLKPVTNQVVNQATDVSGLWPILWGTLSGVFLAICIVTFLTLSNRRKREKETLNVARMSAVVERDNAARALNSFADKIADKKAAGDAIPALAETYFNSASEDYGRVSTQLKFDPSDKSLSLVEYNSITSTYRAINRKLSDAARYLAGVAIKEEPVSTPEPVREYPKSQPYVPPTAPAYTPPAPTQATYIPAPSSDVVIINNQQSTYVAPEPVYEEPVHHHHHEDEDASTSYSSSSDSGGGGSSSWSSSDSSSDSGGSSSYDSGGGDSGGGGSSDY